MTIEESKALRKILVERVNKEANPMDCPFCGGLHRIDFSRIEGEPTFYAGCCEGIKRTVLRIRREVYNDA